MAANNLHNVLKINKVIDFIEQNINEDLSLHRLSDIACQSPFHFHRLFSIICGETVHQFVTRKRIEKAATLLLSDRDASIGDLAMSLGFDNPVTFSRTFKKFYGISATALRKNAAGKYSQLIRQKSKIGKRSISVENYIHDIDAIRSWMGSRTTIDIKILTEQRVAYVRNKGSFDNVINSFIELRERAELEGLIYKDISKWLMIIHDNPAVTEEPKMLQSACLSLNKVKDYPGALGTMIIPEGRFLVGSFVLSEDEFKTAWDGMSIWMIDNGYTSRDGHYIERFHTDSLFKEGSSHAVDICIPVV